MKLFKKAFTLAEVLITLTIIGVVAAITLPSLQNNVNKQALEKQTLKVYTTLSNALTRYMGDERIDEYDSDLNRDENIRKYFKVTSTGGANDGTLFANTYTSIGGASSSINAFVPLGPEREGQPQAQETAYLLADGTVLVFVGDTIIFDVNGTSGPNIIGYDFWQVNINNNQISGDNAPTLAGCTGTAQNAGNPSTCFGYFQQNRFKIDY